MKYGIRLRSKYSGDSITLGCQYDTYEEAEKASKTDERICFKCNSVVIILIPHDKAVWLNKEEGFTSEELFNKMLEEKKNATKKL